MDNIINSNFNIPVKFIISKDIKSILSLFNYCFNSQAGDLLQSYLSSSKPLDTIVSELSASNCSYSIFFNVVNMMLAKFNYITIYIEPIYIDRIHRDSYYSYYSENHLEISRYCKRVLFFENVIDDDDLKHLQENFLGSMVIRPLKTGCIGRTLLSPNVIIHKDDFHYYIRTSNYRINFMGMEFTIRAFPFLTQDGIVTTCAETSIMIMLDYYSNQYNDYHFAVPSEISRYAQKYSNSRVVPSRGLSYAVISKVLCSFGFFTYFHYCGKLEHRRKMRNLLYYYVESGMPVCLNLSKGNVGHSVVCVGHKGVLVDKMLDSLSCFVCVGSTNKRFHIKKSSKPVKRKSQYCLKKSFQDNTYFTSTASGCETLIVMDDNLPPYSEYSFINSSDDLYALDIERKPIQNESQTAKTSFDVVSKLTIDCFIAPLHKRMNMIASRAEEVVLEMIRNKSTNPCIYFQKRISELRDWGKNKDNPLVYRLFLASSRHYKANRIENEEISQAYRLYCLGVPLPQFVWVCELYTPSGYKEGKAIGEIVIDATASPKSNMFDCILMINYTLDNAFFARGLDGKVMNFSQEDNSKEKFNGKSLALSIIKFQGNGFLLKGYKSNLGDYSSK